MKVEQMRSEIANAYPGDSWKTRAKKMSEKQVIAIYHSFLRNDIFNLLRNQTKKEEPTYKQLTFDDMLIGYDRSNGSDCAAVQAK